MKKLFSTLTLTLLSMHTLASDPYVDLRDVNIAGYVSNIEAPNILKVVTKQDDKLVHLYVDLIHVDFGNSRGISCAKTKNENKEGKFTFFKKWLNPEVKTDCERLDDWLEGQDVRLEITEWSQPVLKGYAFLGDKNINHSMIQNGWYPVDYHQSRDASLVLMEKKARCQRVGIWEAKMGIPEEDLKCQD